MLTVAAAWFSLTTVQYVLYFRFWDDVMFAGNRPGKATPVGVYSK